MIPQEWVRENKFLARILIEFVILLIKFEKKESEKYCRIMLKEEEATDLWYLED